MSFIGYKVTCFLWNNLWLKQIIAFIWLTFMFFFCANDVFVSLLLCSKWDDDTNFHSRYRFVRNNNEVSFENKNENTTLHTFRV